jgi:phosphomannomutase
MKQHLFHPSILRQYDVRGIYGTVLSEQDAYAIGFCFGKVVASSGTASLVIARDGRISSPALEKSLIQGAQDAGIDCVLIGLVPTPALYFAVKHLYAGGGIMITGSHNEGHHNGFKMVLADRPFYGQDIQALQDLAKAMEPHAQKGHISHINITEPYITRLMQDYRAPRPLKVVWDAGNGASGQLLEELVQRLPGEHTVLFSEIDGNFPHHHPDPTVPENLTHLQEAVAHHKADLGIAFDGDGDRVGAVDNEGNIFFGDQLMILFSRDVLAHHPGASIIFDVKCSDLLEQDIHAHGGNPIRWSTGHSLIKAKMAETKAVLAGEMSGHIFFADRYYGYDDAIYSAIRLLNIVGHMTKTLSDFYHSMPTLYQTPEVRIPCTAQQKEQVIQFITQSLKASQNQKVSFLDGVRVSNDDGWWLLRASHTQDVLSCRCESKSPSGLDTLKQTIRTYLSKFGIEIPAELG